MSVFVLGVGIAGRPPAGHTYQYLWQHTEVQTADALSSLPLPALLKREKKIQMIALSASAALAPIIGQTDLLQRCGFIVTTRWDGRFPTMVDKSSNRLISFTDLPPSSVALSIVAHVAESCVPMLLNMQGPALTMSSKSGLIAAIKIGTSILQASKTPIILVQEFELALPGNLQQQGLEPQQEYAISVLLSLQSWGRNVIGELML